MISLPPVDPSVNEIEIEELPGVAESDAGAEGGVAGVLVTGTEVVPVPTALMAFRYTVDGIPFVRPETVTGELVWGGLKGMKVIPSVEYE